MFPLLTPTPLFTYRLPSHAFIEFFSSKERLNTQLIIHIIGVKNLARKPVDVKTSHPLGLPISWGVKASGDLLYTSGLVASDPVTGKLIEGDFEAQTRRTFDNLKEVLKAAGTSMQNVVKVNIYISDWKDFPTLNQIWIEYFGTDNPPARTTVQVAGFIGGIKVEIELVATIPKK